MLVDHVPSAATKPAGLAAAVAKVCRIMVPPGKFKLLILLFVTATADAVAATKFGMSSEFLDSKASAFPEFPDEDPSELQLKDWVKQAERNFRKTGLLAFTVAAPVKLSEFADKPDLIEPSGTKF